MDRTTDFFRGISGGLGRGRGNTLDFIFFLLIIGIIALVIWAINEYVKSYKKGKKIDLSRTFRSFIPEFLKSSSTLNALQKKILGDLIKDFKKREILAEGIPSAILEKFGEFLYANISKLKVSEKEARNFININYPILKGYNVELDFQKEGILSLISTRVVNVSNRYVQVEYPVNTDVKILKGMNAYINYNVGKQFLRGSTTVLDVRRDNTILLSKPTGFVLSSERLYPRLPLKGVEGKLYNPRTSMSYNVELIDISFEGVRISSDYGLQKNIVYLLEFETKIDDRFFSFSNLECSVSKSFLGSGGRKEYGMAFLYLNSETRVKLSILIKELALRIQKQKSI